MDAVFKALNLDKSDQIPPGVDIENRRISGWLSTVQMDRDGEVVLPSAFEKHLDVYKQNPVLFLFHQHKSLPIGKAVNIEVRSEGLWGEFQIAKTQTGDEVLQLVAEGCLRGFSAGFVPIDYEENPSPYKIPAEAMRTSMGRKPKKLYREVELVETSLLGIPSNRGSLITQVEKGNRVAGLVVKAFDATEKGEDISLIIKEWMRENTFYTLKSLLVNSEPLELKYTLKSLLWNENEHPRDNSGQFASKPSSYEPYKDIWEGRSRIDVNTGRAIRPQDQEQRYEERMDKIVSEQKETNRQLQEINDKDSWGSWFKKWAVRIGVAVGTYFAYKRFKKSPMHAEIKKKAREWLINQALKGYEKGDHSDLVEFGNVLDNLTNIKSFLEKGNELGLSGTPEYKKAEKLYVDGVRNIKKLSNETVGLKGLLEGVVIKEMSAEEFDESEHPRAADGKFRKKDGAGVQKRQPGKVDEEIKKVVPDRISQALDHPDEPGAGAAKRRELDLDEKETIRAVMSEFKRGTLRSGSGEVVTDQKQAKAIALSEARKNKKTKGKEDEGFNFDDPKYKKFKEKYPEEFPLGLALGVAAAVGVAVYSYHKKDVSYLREKATLAFVSTTFGYEVATRSSLFKRNENVEAAKLSADEITKSCKNPHPNKDAINKIINIEIENNVYKDKKRTRFQQQMIDYINSDSFQKDLAERFGHLEEGGTKKVVLYSNYNYNFLNPKNLVKNNVCYLPLNDTIYINTAMHENLGKAVGENITPRDIIMHEYAHSITCNNDEVTKRSLPDYQRFCKKLKGKEIDIPAGISLPDKYVNPIIDESGWWQDRQAKIIDMEKLSYGNRQKLKVLDVEFEEMSNKKLLEKLPFFLKNKNERFEKGKDRWAKFKVQTEDGQVKELGTPDILNIMSWYSLASSQEDKVADIARNAVKIEGLKDHRRVYGMTHMTEWISVKVEKGEKI